jgi:Protein of unknown function (DUF3012)/Prokaryotic membrane lipoprotein lipid attachment site
MKNILLALVATALLSACAPKVGSPKWCENMAAKAKGDWSLNEAKDYAQHCVLK